VKRQKITAVCLAILTPIIWYVVVELTDKRNADEVRYDRLVSARRSEARFMLWRMKPWYARLSKLTRFDPVSHYQKKAEALETALLSSGALVYVSFYQPTPSAYQRTANLARPLITATGGLLYVPPAQPSEMQCVRSWSDKDEISLLCRPRDVVYWQSTYCRITNRVSWGKLRKLGGNREEIMCILPDARIVELNDGQKWLNDSIESGWLVGVCASNKFLIALRRKPAPDQK